MNRIVLLLLTAMLGLQVAMYFKQPQSGQALPSGRPQPVQDAPKDAVVEISGLPIQGMPHAKAVVVEFSDYECPFCARYSTGAYSEIKEQFVQTGKVRYAFANNILPIHPSAKLMATAAICAGRQDRYWEMHDVLFRERATDRPALLAAAEYLKIDRGKFEECFSDQSLPRQLDRESQMARRLELRGTPAFVIGIVNSKGEVEARKVITGAQSFPMFESVINEVLRKG